MAEGDRGIAQSIEKGLKKLLSCGMNGQYPDELI
jgi:hypothetical protein